MFSTPSAPTGGALPFDINPCVLVAELVEPLRRLARAIAAAYPGAEAEDLLQVALEASWRMLPAYDRTRARLYTFVYPRARGAMIEACLRLRGEPANDSGHEDLVDPRPTIEQRLLDLEQRRRVLARFSPVDRELIRLCAIEGEPLRVAARRVGLDYKCAWARLQKAQRRMGA